ncbi:hypothetical protein [Brevibacillus reuszeri]|uniref:hypothetical protein n=1 Tax=Brevibacillus reuszeri TaxID=54915 RepID=UPI00289B16DE|nr:hypothetical protein [Brevibacillus reuszeri]
MPNDMVQIIINQSKEKLATKQLLGHEVIVGIISISKNYSLNEETVSHILHEVYSGDKIRLLNDLEIASLIIDEGLIQRIIKGVN